MVCAGEDRLELYQKLSLLAKRILIGNINDPSHEREELASLLLDRYDLWHEFKEIYINSENLTDDEINRLSTEISSDVQFTASRTDIQNGGLRVEMPEPEVKDLFESDTVEGHKTWRKRRMYPEESHEGLLPVEEVQADLMQVVEKLSLQQSAPEDFAEPPNQIFNEIEPNGGQLLQQSANRELSGNVETHQINQTTINKEFSLQHQANLTFPGNAARPNETREVTENPFFVDDSEWDVLGESSILPEGVASGIGISND